MSAIDTYLQKIPKKHHESVKKLHSLITGSFPTLQCSLKWGKLTYHTDRNICSIVSHANHINLQLWDGALLDDPKSLLEGTGKSMRHIKIRGSEDINFNHMVPLLKQAITENNS
ncbi:DUF1801 domain-containing protein [Aliifodinibius sp. S!AR15-10]|uniref:DUF1801 domain-containing protein n=1 Tax=Aliifodinibius sp. S!AR15-10 TaxID=2950437 RepID=UPI00286363B2|nr:DUF1801 domain-containing protein [Aliifodinibius sp. S!AR15-10]MDR8392605.1 DUF1801 domain-containing protein [Aliifodinibius sp. S!AR15-10]